MTLRRLVATCLALSILGAVLLTVTPSPLPAQQNNQNNFYTATLYAGLDGATCGGADIIAKAIACSANANGAPVQLGNFSGTQVVGTETISTSGQMYVFPALTLQIQPSKTLTLSGSNNVLVFNGTTIDESQPVYNAGTITAMNGTGNQTVTGSGTNWTSALVGGHLVCGLVDFGAFTVVSTTQLHLNASPAAICSGTGPNAGTIGSYNSAGTFVSGAYDIGAPHTIFPFIVGGTNNTIVCNNCTFTGDLFASQGTSIGPTTTGVGHTNLEVTGATGFRFIGLGTATMQQCGVYCLYIPNASYTRLSNLILQQSASAALNVDANSVQTFDNVADTIFIYECNESPTPANTGTYCLNAPSTGGTGFNSGWTFKNIVMKNDQVCTVGPLCDGTTNDDAGNSTYIPTAQIGNQGPGTITSSSTSSTSVTLSGTPNSNFWTNANLAGAQMYYCANASGSCGGSTYLGTVSSVSGATVTLNANATATLSSNLYTFYVPLSLSSTGGSLGGFQPLGTIADWDFSGTIRNFEAEGTTPQGTHFNLHDVDCSLTGVVMDGSPRGSGSGCVSLFLGSALMGNGTIHDIRTASSGYTLKFQLGGSVAVDTDVMQDITIHDVVDYVDASQTLATFTGIQVINNSGATACGAGTRKCNWLISNVTLTNVDVRSAQTQETYSGTGLTLTNFCKIAPAGWMGTVIPTTCAYTAPLNLGSTSQKSETTSADANVLTVTPPPVVGTYRACVSVSVSAATSGVIGWTLSWTDSNGNAQSNIAEPLFQSGTAAPALTFTTSAASEYDACHTFDINNAAANIVVKWVGGGTTTAKMSASIERII